MQMPKVGVFAAIPRVESHYGMSLVDDVLLPCRMSALGGFEGPGIPNDILFSPRLPQRSSGGVVSTRTIANIVTVLLVFALIPADMPSSSRDREPQSPGALPHNSLWRS